MVITDADVIFSHYPRDYAWLRFLAQATGGTAVGVLGEVL